MNHKEVLFIDETKEKINLNENIKYVHVDVVANQEYTLFGNIYFDTEEVERKILLTINFENVVLSKEESMKLGFSYSKKYGGYKYLSTQIKDQFTFTFTIPDKAVKMTLGFRCWYNEYNVQISSKLTLTNKILSLYDMKNIGQTLERRLYSQMAALMHMYNMKKSDYLLLTTRYPAFNDYYRNSFIHARVRGYIENGVHPDVFSIRNDNNALEHYRFEEVHVTKGSGKTFDDLLTFHNYKNILVHFLSARMWNHLKKYIDYTKVYVWIHGAEIQPWHRRAFNHATEEALTKAKELSAERMKFWKALLTDIHPNLKLIFVSQYFADEVMEDLGIVLPQSSYEVIHNYINTGLFSYKPKTKEQRKKILSIRPYASRKYANDLSVQAVLYIKEHYPEIFSDLEFRFIGDGVLFDETLSPIKDLENVTIERTFLKQEDIAALHKSYGLFLSPTRMDSQGVSRDEAMSSGLVPLTNNITAIPEFVDGSCGILTDADEYAALAEGIIALYKNPDLFLEMSKNAAQRVREQSGYAQTIAKELDMINKKSNGTNNEI